MKTKVKLRTVITIALVVLSFFSLPVLSVWKKSKVVAMARDNELLREKIRLSRNANVVLGFEKAELLSRARIEAMALTELSLVYPLNEQVTVVRVEPAGAPPAKADPPRPPGVAAVTR